MRCLRWVIPFILLACRREPPAPTNGPVSSATATTPPSSAAAPASAMPPVVAASSVAASPSSAASPAAPFAPFAPMAQADWEPGPGKWTFEADGTLACECKSNSHVIWWKKERPKDFDASVEVQFLGDESSAGIVFRAAGQDFYNDMSFYQFEWYTRGTHHDKRLSLMRKNPYWVQIVTPTEPEAPYHRWIVFRVRAEGDHLQTFIDGERTFDQKDATFVRPGRIGLHVFQPRRTLFRKWSLAAL